MVVLFLIKHGKNEEQHLGEKLRKFQVLIQDDIYQNYISFSNVEQEFNSLNALHAKY